VVPVTEYQHKIVWILAVDEYHHGGKERRRRWGLTTYRHREQETDSRGKKSPPRYHASAWPLRSGLGLGSTKLARRIVI
jgi:hypothetical protein